jgi:penicillin-binding protein 1C
MRASTKRALRGCAAAALGTPLAAALAFFTLDALFPFPTELLDAAPQSPTLEGRDGTPLQVRLGSDEQWRRPVRLEEISPWLIESTIAVEDRRFRKHHGVDPLAILRAAAQNLGGGQVVSGASTLSMQVVKMVSAPAERTLTTKLTEAFRALQLERLRSKDEILELYLNLAPYGGNHRGVESGALAHFGKHASDLSLDEATLLAGLPQSPTHYSPTRHAERAIARRERVLEASVREGKFDASEARMAAESALRLDAAPRPSLAPHFSSVALTQRPAGGRTTLDLELQRSARELVEQHALGLPNGADISVCVIELESGALRALIGSADPDDPNDGQVNGASAWRSPGSALKPFAYAAAFEARVLSPESTLDDSAIDLAGWQPQNFDGQFAGEVSVRDALRRSLNIPALRAAKLAGSHRVVGVLESCGVRFRPGAAQSAGLGLVTGAAEVRLLDLTNAYATLGRDGEFMELRYFEDEPRQTHRALSREACESLHRILDSADRLPQARPEAPHFCWKTGTSSGFRDAWALGHDERYAIGVWVGNFSGAGDPSFVGAGVATPLLVQLFERAE